MADENIEKLRDAIQQLIFHAIHEPGLLSDDWRELNVVLNDAVQTRPDVITAELCDALRSEVNAAIGYKRVGDDEAMRTELRKLTDRLEFLRVS